MQKKFLVLGAVLVAVVLIVAACASPTPVTETVEVTREVPVEVTRVVEVMAEPVVAVVPYAEQWQASPHNALDTEAFVHWSNEESKFEVPTSCAKCHATAGYQDFLGDDGSEAGKVDAAVSVADGNPGIQCQACHNPVTLTKTTVMFPSGVEVTAGDDARCMECHQGRESKVSVDKQITDFSATDPDAIPAPIKDANGNDRAFGFRNVHYYAAAATLYGGVAQGGYQYDGKTYDAKNTHVEGYASCTGCHNPHTLEVKVDQCAMCHEGVASTDDLKNIRMISSNPDYDGDGNVEEGMYYEIEGLQETLLAEIQKYAADKAGAEIKYDAATYPYFMGADGKAYPSWTPRLLKASYNYQVSQKDPGSFAHGNKYIVQLLYDSIEDLGGDVSALARTDAGHFAGDTLPFRDWDDSATGVPFRCVKCHTAEGMPTFVKNGGSVVVDGRGNTVTTGVGNMHPSNGFLCSTCHNEEAWPERYSIASVVFPSGKSASLGGKNADGAFVADDSNLCLLCHQGRESSLSVNNALRGKDDDTPDKAISFKNIHYLGAGATLFGSDAAGGYQYADKQYFGQNLHASETGKMNKCADCHDVHALEPKVEECETCHDTTDPLVIRGEETPDYDGDGDTAEGVAGELETLEEALYAEIQKYADATAKAGITYSAAAYPYFFLDMDKDGNPDKNDQGGNLSFNAWTPRLLRAAFNFQYAHKDPGAFVHNPKYVVQLLIDSIADLGGSVGGYTRP